MSYLGWDQQGSDFYIWIDAAVCDLEHAVSALAYYKVSGPASTIAPDVADYYGKKRLHVNVPQAALPNGTEVDFWVEVTMDDTSVTRVPASGSIIIRVYR